MNKHPLISLMLTILIFSSFSQAAKTTKHDDHSFLDHIRINVENDILILSDRYDENESVKITPAYQLYINGEKVKLTRRERKLVARYYHKYFELYDYAVDIGREGAKIGKIGAEIGIKAAAGIIKAIFDTEFSLEDLEDEVEWEEDNLEELIEEFEEKAHEIEETAEEFDELHSELKDEIDELNDLGWF